MKFSPLRDFVFVGFLSGMAGGCTVNLITLPVYYLGFTRFALLHWGTAIMMQETRFDPGALIIGFLAHAAVSTGLGMLVAYLLLRTGKDFYIIKGLVVSLLFWVSVYGIASPLLLPPGFPKLDLATAAAEFAGQVAAGVLAAYFIAAFADPHLRRGDELK